MTPEITKEDFSKLPQDLQEQIVSALSEFNKSDEIIQDNEEELESIKLPEILKNDADILLDFKLPIYLDEYGEEIYLSKIGKPYKNNNIKFTNNIFREYINIFNNDIFNDLIKYVKIKSNGKIIIKESNFYTGIKGPNKQYILKNTETGKELKFSFGYSNTPYLDYSDKR